MSSAPRRLVGLSAIVLGTLLVTPALALSFSPAPALAGAGQTYTDASLRIATFNTEATQSTKKAMKDIAALAAQQPDIITLQEMANPQRRALVRATLVDCATCVYDAYMPLPAVPGSTPILFRSDRFSLVSTATVQVTQDTYVGPRGAGPSTIRAKFINWVRLKDLTTGRGINVLNNHFVPSVQGHSGGPNRSMRKRLGIYQLHMQGLLSIINSIIAARGGVVFATGDFNVNFRRDVVLHPKLFPFYNLGLVRMQASYAALGQPLIGTHILPSGNDTRLIDYVNYRTRKALTPVSQQIMTGLHSDHRPLLVDFDVTARAPTPVPPGS